MAAGMGSSPLATLSLISGRKWTDGQASCLVLGLSVRAPLKTHIPNQNRNHQLVPGSDPLAQGSMSRPHGRRSSMRNIKGTIICTLGSCGKGVGLEGEGVASGR